ncbi:hypothetical protein HanRHA438_Chr15g0731421 [Helianthus annuus]|uniref:RIN4 pathogenic type III effector avirulence factor Avr cleavage site domain-containing protein n=1 Tax=Helianthus annuus TaxID=4232 RepID=A0A251SBZ6_HELAN|nr:uncharacterized protein LOC110912754 [Helianthus annuus]KAF5766746.1 hypothetical protein HanXRQr2_Chr15g0719071 [Helianthus annuus]KAJ0833396.1 hypothetical protein HanPSC8_Chr15g0689911 [Helianthus annuus]KAJ0847015.1 hypothetical protein HanRHA438_Chr15g0731421 [Helianthus annuus]
MEHRKDEKNAPWMSMPQFGDWDQKGPLPDYSLNFSKIREMKKQNKREISRASIGNEELISSNTTKVDNSVPIATHHSNYDHDHDEGDHHHSLSVRRSILSYFNCCVKA